MQDGDGDDWPISYADLAPYYDRAETLIGVFGTRENLAVLPDGNFMPPPPPRCGEVELMAGGRKAGIPIIPIRRAMLTRHHDGRAACHYCGACDRGCATASRFSTLDAIIPKLAPRRNITLRTGAAVHRVTLDRQTGRARGVEYIDTRRGRSEEARARVVVLGAGAMESTRILLNSRSADGAAGLSNSSGVLGHYLMDNFKAGFIGGYLPALKGRAVENEDGAGGGHVYVPRFTNIPGGRRVAVQRGFQFQPGSGADMFPGYARGLPGFGSGFKREVREQNPARIGLAGFGEMLPRYENYCEIDPGGLRDRYGIPQLRFHARWGENELKMAELMYDAAEELLRAAGAEVRPYRRVVPPPPGDATHEVGTARMGADPKKSVLNGFNQSHEVKNLFVVDGASFVSAPEKNCTLTILAVAWRASEYLADELKRGRLG
jgi:choline dehydrogenase-like flavoprotein